MAAPIRKVNEMQPTDRAPLGQTLVLLGAGLLVAACGTPASSRDNGDKSVAAAQVEGDECNVKEAAARIVYGDPPPAQELNPEAEQALCEKAEILLAELEAIEEGQENSGTPGDPLPLEADYYEEDEIFSEQEANEAPSNRWRGVVDDKNVTVSSGWEIKSPSSGIVELQVIDPYSGVRELDKVIPAPASNRPGRQPKLEIKSEATGEVAVFDVKEQLWLK